MAFITVNMMSEALMRTVTVNVILPTDKFTFPGMPEPRRSDFPTLYLLLGVFGSHVDWVCGTRVQRWAEEKGLAVVMPAGENAFYLDHEATHANYGDFVGRELPEQMRRMFPLSGERERTFIAGLSMGGFGALRNGLKYHETFGRVAGLSSALIVEGLEARTDDAPIVIETRSYAEDLFGDLSKVAESDKNPLWTARGMARSGVDLPKMYLACGTKDSLYGVNERACRELRDLGFDVTWDEAPFGHEWDFWDLEIKKVIDWLPIEQDGVGVNSGNVGI